MKKIYVLIFIVLSFLIYFLFKLFEINNKKIRVINSNNFYQSHIKIKFFNSYINKIETKLFNLGFPYKLTTKKFLIIKYIASIIFGVIAYVNYRNIFIALIFITIIFFIPDYLIINFKNREKYILINEIKNLTGSIILNLSAYSTLEQALNKSKQALEYKRFIEAYNKFIYEYKMNGYSLKEASSNLESTFYSYDLSLFLATLIQGNMEGNLLENMEKFSETLELNYFKYLKKKNTQRLLYVTLGTIISLINVVIVVMYPMFKQVLDNLQFMFS